MSVIRFALVCCLALGMFGLASHAQAIIIWDNGDGTWEWNTANNWNPNTVPTSSSGSDALFDSTSPSGTPITVTGATPLTRHLSFGTAGGGLFPVASYTFEAGTDGVLNFRSVSSTFLANSSNTVTTQTFNVPVSAGNTLNVVTMGGSFVFNGSTNVGSNLKFVDGDLDGIPGDEVGSSIYPVALNGGLTGTGAVNINSAIVVTVGAGGATYTGATNVNNGTYRMNGTHTGGAAYTVNTGGTLGGTGTINAPVTVNAGGAIAPGVGIESLDVDALTLETGSLLNFELGAPSTADLINVAVSGGLTLNGGTFNFTNAGGLAAGTYTLINYDGVLGGSFANLDLGLTQPAGFTFTLVDNVDNTSIDVLVAGAAGLPGDYNNNGTVDSADYVLWRKGGPLQNDPTPATVDASDYDFWRAHFGNTAPGSGSSLGGGAAVPEPSTLALAVLAIMGLANSSRRGLARG
jgi:hypothetical protein